MTVGSLSPPPRRSARIVGLGAARPGHTVPGAVLVERFGKSAEWLRQRTGITELRRLRAGESLLELGIRAGRRALADAPGEPDLVVVATCSADPATTPLAHGIAAAIAPRAAAFDINAACAGFCYGLGIAGSLVETHGAERVLVVGAEQMSALVDPADLGTSILFGDGAGAAVVARSDDPASGISAPAWTSDGGAADVLRVPDGATALRMDGPRVFRWAVDEVHKVATEAIAKAGLRPDDIEVFVPHQANLRIVEAIVRKLGLHNAVTATDVVDSGNTSAASIPMALHRLRRSAPATHGRVALLAGFGAGLTIAAQVVRLP